MVVRERCYQTLHHAANGDQDIQVRVGVRAQLAAHRAVRDPSGCGASCGSGADGRAGVRNAKPFADHRYRPPAERLHVRPVFLGVASGFGVGGRGRSHKTRRCRGVTYPESYITKYKTYTKRNHPPAERQRVRPVGRWCFGGLGFGVWGLEIGLGG